MHLHEPHRRAAPCERILDRRVKLGANLRIGCWFGEHQFRISLMLGDAMRVFAVMAGLMYLYGRVVTATSYATITGRAL